MTEADEIPQNESPAPAETRPVSITHGVAVIERALETMPLVPGVYRMLDGKGDALYVGKARSLRSA
jgi:excinuclease ABC subunit C